MILRPATEVDVPAVAALELEAFPTDAWTADYLSAAVRGELTTISVHVATLGGEVVGHAIVSTLFEDAELQRIASVAARRRTGIATALLGEVVEYATARGAERMLLEVREGNEPARAFYARAGFEEIDRRPRYYRDGTTAIVLQRTLLPGPGQGR